MERELKVIYFEDIICMFPDSFTSIKK